LLGFGAEIRSVMFPEREFANEVSVRSLRVRAS
jgi:hypothetical protein